MSLTIFPPEGAILQLGKIHDVVAKVEFSEPTLPFTKVVWTLEGTGATVDPAESAVAAYGGGFYASTQIKCSTLGKVKLTATATPKTGAAVTSSVNYVVADLKLANVQLLVNRYAEITPFGEPMNAEIEKRVLHIFVKVLDEKSVPVAGHPVYLDFDPPVVSLYAGVAPYNAVTLPLDPIGKGYIAMTDQAGEVVLRVLSSQPTIGRFSCIAAGGSHDQLYAFIDPAVTDPLYPAPEGVIDPVVIPPDSATFVVKVKSSFEPAGLLGVIWLKGKDGECSFGEITSIEALQKNGDVFSYDTLDNSGKTLNRLAYLVQRGANGFESFPVDFTATGDPFVDPDPHVTRTLDAPLLTPPKLVNMAALEKGVVLTIPRFLPGDIERADMSYQINAVLYLNAWDPTSGRVKRKRVALPPLSVASAPATDLTINVPESALLDYAFEPAPGRGVGTIAADYEVVSGTTGAVRYSKIMGRTPNPPILLETTYKSPVPNP